MEDEIKQLNERISRLEEMAETYRRKIVKNKRSNDRISYVLYFTLGICGVAIFSSKYDADTGYHFAVDPQLITAVAGGIGGLFLVGKSALDDKKDDNDLQPPVT